MPTARFLIAATAFCLLSACATLPPGERDPRDPHERINRYIFQFNDVMDRKVAKPVAKTYVKVTPAPVRSGLSNFFRNLGSPTAIVNSLLQGKVADMFVATARMVVNSTIGIGGLFDPASQLGIPVVDEDFGQTLAVWGVPSGPYLVMPFIGPSTARDSVGFAGNLFTDPRSYISDPYLRHGLRGATFLNVRVNLLGTDEILERTFDPYAFMRSAYLQRREYQILDGEVSAVEDFEIFEDEQPEPTEDAASPPEASEDPSPSEAPLDW